MESDSIYRAEEATLISRRDSDRDSSSCGGGEEAGSQPQQGQVWNRIKNLRDIKSSSFQQTCILQTDRDSHRSDSFSGKQSRELSPAPLPPNICCPWGGSCFCFLHMMKNTDFAKSKLSYQMKCLGGLEAYYGC